MSSSLRNAVKRKTHKERAQPSGRKKLGLLEKKKDYKLRAQDYSSKKKRLEALRLKAELRNEDEFYFGMVNQRTKDGVHKVDEQGGNPGEDVLRLVRTQNKGYLEMHLAHERAQAERLKQGLHFVGASSGTHTVFVDDEQEQRAFDAAKYLETDPKLVEFRHNRFTRHQLIERQDRLQQDEERQVKTSDKAYAKLNHSLARVEALQASVDHLQLKRALMGKGKRIKVKDAEGDKPAVFRWKNERKR